MKQLGIGLTLIAALTACASAGLSGADPVRAFGTVEGSVTDSVRHSLLPGAYVELQPGGKQRMVDARGRFRFDSVPADHRYTLSLFHPLLDTLGIAVAAPEFTMLSGANAMTLAVPSPARLVSTICPATQLTSGPSAVIGFVRYMDTGLPVDSATVTLTFSDGAMTRTDVPDAQGRYHFCGLPERLNGRLQLTRKGLRTDWIDVTTTVGAPLALRSLGFPKAPVKPPL